MKDVFLPLIGQYENIGDIMLRRPLASWLQGIAKLHVFTGHAPKDYIEGLELNKDQIVYESFSSWYSKGLRSGAKSKNNAYLFKPGEIQLSLPGMKEHIGVLPLMLWLKLRGGKVARLGSGTRNFSSAFKKALAPSISASDLIYWRDKGTLEFLKCGQLMPDLAFFEGTPVDGFTPAEQRNYLVISMRYDRPFLSDPWINAIKTFAAEHNLTICAVAQVEQDSPLAERLAQKLGGESLTWDGKNHLMQERALRALYQKTQITLSDRLHVLIAAFTEGALPTALTTDQSTKIQRHFDALDLKNVGIDTSVNSPEEAQSFFNNRLSERESYYNALRNARRKLEAIKQELIEFLSC